MIRDATIFALSSGPGRAGVAVIRISGPEAGSVFTHFGTTSPPPRQAALRRLRDGEGATLDEALVLWLPGPGTATGEDMAEFHVHGAPSVVRAVLTSLGDIPGFGPAEPGAFTHRAFRNRRLDLLQVEGLSDVLQSETEAQRRLAMRQFLGEASSIYEGWRKGLLRAVALVEAAIDFSDEDDVALRAADEAAVVARDLAGSFRRAMDQADGAAQVRRGLRVVLAGAPNVGKSSLLNWLAGRDAAIVSPQAGTTRDVVEAPVVLGGLPVMIADTAGLREDSADAIEREGMRRTRAAVDDADILVWLETAGGTGEVRPSRTPEFRVCTKVDLVPCLDRHAVWPLSVKSGEGLEEFRRALETLIRERNHLGQDAVVVRERHRIALQSALDHLHHVEQARALGLEFMAEDMRKAAAALAGIMGVANVEDVLGEIFSAFCIGK